MLPIDKCLFCEGKLSQKTVTEIIKNDEDTVSLDVSALVCDNCGDRYYHLETMKKFELIKQKLKSRQTKDLIVTGKSYLLKE
ncbi:YgiT-type zinc finger protein [Cyanobacterium aponinum]|uniref:YgiT-type zinc finger protein n=1 Tax=Cyanobacterium aponinum TaxID=379064 RepID=UPI000C12A762|nr:YgiT-type zinc finger protein [Cyanobacterium aponinum]PHV62806.1 YgiT-type zinc finger domain-containing protein [Cyanobacterium aponinum IPPAS B-1201]